MAIPIDRHDDPDRWHELVDTVDAIVTQVDDGNLLDGKGGMTHRAAPGHHRQRDEGTSEPQRHVRRRSQERPGRTPLAATDRGS
jgi:hypothetical protein